MNDMKRVNLMKAKKPETERTLSAIFFMNPFLANVPIL